MNELASNLDVMEKSTAAIDENISVFSVSQQAVDNLLEELNETMTKISARIEFNSRFKREVNKVYLNLLL